MSSTEDRRIKLVVTPDYWDSRAGATLNAARSAFKMGAGALRVGLC